MPLPRLKFLKNPKKRCPPIMKAFKKLDEEFPKLPNFVNIKRSTIKGAGKGVFLKCDIQAGTRLGFYRGKCYPPEKGPQFSAYLLEISFNGKPYVTSDGAPLKHSNWTRFINCPEREKDANVEFVQYGKIMYIKAIKNISGGSELFLWYGEEYVENMLREYFKGFRPKQARRFNKNRVCPVLNR
jgi:hypothetical protein